MTASPNLFWDACVFVRYLTQFPQQGLADLDRFLEDARRGERTIYFSTISLAEVRPSFLTKRPQADFAGFVRTMGRACIGIDPNPNIMTAAGYLKDASPTNPSDAKANKRVIGTGDAINLATCLWLRDVLEITDVMFHTYDEGKGKNWEGKCVPILDMERWFPVASRPQSVVDVCSLPRSKPIHPQPDLLVGSLDEWKPHTGPSH